MTRLQRAIHVRLWLAIAAVLAVVIVGGVAARDQAVNAISTARQMSDKR